MLQLRNIEVVKYADQSVIVTGLTKDISLLRRPLPGAFNGMKVEIINSAADAVGMQ